LRAALYLKNLIAAAVKQVVYFKLNHSPHYLTVMRFVSAFSKGHSD